MSSTDTKSEREYSLQNLKDELLSLASLKRGEVVTTDSKADPLPIQWIADAKSSSKNNTSMARSTRKMPHGEYCKIFEVVDGFWLGQGEQQRSTMAIEEDDHPMIVDEDVELGDDGSFYASDDDKPINKTTTSAKAKLDWTPNGQTKNTKKKSSKRMKETQRMRTLKELGGGNDEEDRSRTSVLSTISAISTMSNISSLTATLFETKAKMVKTKIDGVTSIVAPVLRMTEQSLEEKVEKLRHEKRESVQRTEEEIAKINALKQNLIALDSLVAEVEGSKTNTKIKEKEVKRPKKYLVGKKAKSSNKMQLSMKKQTTMSKIDESRTEDKDDNNALYDMEEEKRDVAPEVEL